METPLAERTPSSPTRVSAELAQQISSSTKVSAELARKPSSPTRVSAELARQTRADDSLLPCASPLDSETRPRKKRKGDRHCTFGSVHVLTHGPRLDGSKLPAEGPGVGLGPLEHESVHSLEVYELRERLGVRRCTPNERREAVSPLHRQLSIERVEQEVALVIRQRIESAGDLEEPCVSILSALECEDIGLTDLWC